MLVSILQRIRKIDQVNPVLGVGRGNILLARNLRISSLATIRRRGVDVSLPAIFFPLFALLGFNFVEKKSIDVTLDASGFAYSSSWGLRPITSALARIRKWKSERSGSKSDYIFLPQAFGPFDSEASRESMRLLCAEVVKIFARDNVSAHHLQSLPIPAERISISPDFTGTTKPASTTSNPLRDGEICIIVNYRMIDKLSQSEATQYKALMKILLDNLRTAGNKVFFLVHDTGDDLSLAKSIISDSQFKDTEILNEEDPLSIKKILGQCKLVVCARYHGIASAISQNIPTIAIGWSHKYEELLNDYGVPDLLVKDLSDTKGALMLANLLAIDGPFRVEILQRLNKGNKLVASSTENMWNEVELIIKTHKLNMA